MFAKLSNGCYSTSVQANFVKVEAEGNPENPQGEDTDED